MNAKALAFTEGSRGMLSRTNFFSEKAEWGGGGGGGRGRGGGAEVSLCAVSVPTHVLQTLVLIKAKTFSKEVVIRIRKYELHFDIPWDTYWEYLGK